MIAIYRHVDPQTGAWIIATPTRVRLGGTSGAIDGRYRLEEQWPDPGGPDCTIRDMVASLIQDEALRTAICGLGDRCGYCGRYGETRHYYRYTNPQSGQWCRDCRDRWAMESTFWPASHGSILDDGWSSEEEQEEDQ